MSTGILLIDDDVIEAEYTLRMLQREHPDAVFDHVRDGIDELMKVLRRLGIVRG